VADKEMRGFEDLECYQLALQVFREGYRVASLLPPEEKYNLADQLQRAATSVILNIAEGYGRFHYLDSLRFYYIARGSLMETLSALIACDDRKYTSAEISHQRELCHSALRSLNGTFDMSAGNNKASRNMANTPFVKTRQHTIFQTYQTINHPHQPTNSSIYQPTMPQPTKFIIAGLGSIGRRHLRNLVALGERDIVLLRTRKATLPDDELAGYSVETDIHEALKKHQSNAVIVANPTSLHLDVAIPAAEAGCAILLEKPVSDSLDRLDLLQKTAQKSGSKILVGFQFRYHPTLNHARELIQSGALGRVLTVHAHRGEYLPQWHPWEDYRRSYAARADLGGGVIRTLTHPLDYLRYLIGEVEALWSFNGHLSPLELDVEDVAEIGLKFTNGALGGIHLNYVQRPPRHALEIVGTAGTLRWDNADGILHLHQASAPFGSYSDNPPAPVTQTFAPPDGFERNHLFVSQTRHFIETARGESEPVCALEDGIAALRLALAAVESQSTSRIWINDPGRMR